MINKRSESVENLVVLTFFDHISSFGQNKTGISPGIANKKGTLLWDDQIPLNFCLNFVISLYYFSSILSLKSSLSLFLAKINNKTKKEVEKN